MWFRQKKKKCYICGNRTKQKTHPIRLEDYDPKSGHEFLWRLLDVLIEQCRYCGYTNTKIEEGKNDYFKVVELTEYQKLFDKENIYPIDKKIALYQKITKSEPNKLKDDYDLLGLLIKTYLQNWTDPTAFPQHSEIHIDYEWGYGHNGAIPYRRTIKTIVLIVWISVPILLMIGLVGLFRWLF